MAGSVCAALRLPPCEGSAGERRKQKIIFASADDSELPRFSDPVLLYYFPGLYRGRVLLLESMEKQEAEGLYPLWGGLRGFFVAGCGQLSCLSFPYFQRIPGDGGGFRIPGRREYLGKAGFFSELVNGYLFNGFLWFWLLLLVVLACTVAAGRKKAVGKVKMEDAGGESHVEAVPYFLLLFAAAGYFFTVSKTALLLYETSNRYQHPIYGILLFLVMAAVYELWNRAVFLLGRKGGRDFAGVGKGGAVFSLRCFFWEIFMDWHRGR